MASLHRLGAHALTALLPGPAELGTPRYRSLAEAIAALLLDGRIAPGSALPSERELASALGLSRSTTSAAYQRLADDGLMSRRRGAGSYLQLPAGARTAGPGSRVSRAGDRRLVDLSVAALAGLPATLQPAIARAATRLAVNAAGTSYLPYGLPTLREQLADRFRGRGVPTDPEQILITNGAQHSLDLLLRLLLNPGDRVLMELPTYPGALDAVRAQAGRVVGAPFAADGLWDVAGLTGILLQTSPALAFLIPDFHNPTGVLVPTDQREPVLAAARRAGTRVIVDESFVELDLRRAADRQVEHAPMAAVSSAVISIGSLSKPVWGGMRVGWIRAEADLIARLAIVRARSDMSGSVFDQLLASELLDDLTPTLLIRRVELRANQAALLAALAAELPQWQAKPAAGGLSCWVRLDSPAATALSHQLEDRGILIAPGSRFTVDASLERYLRIPFSLPADVLTSAVAEIGPAWRELDRHRTGRREVGALVTA